MNGLGITIIAGQLPKLFGFSTDADSFPAEVRRSSRTSTRRTPPRSWSARGPRRPARAAARHQARAGGARRRRRRHRRLGRPRTSPTHGVATVGALPQGVPTTVAAVDERERRAAAADGGDRHHPRVADRHDRDRDELRGPSRRRGGARPGDDRHGRREHRRGPVPGLRRLDERLADRGGRAVGGQEPAHRCGRSRRSSCSCCCS